MQAGQQLSLLVSYAVFDQPSVLAFPPLFRETRLEEWMDEDSKPPPTGPPQTTSKGIAPPKSSTAAANSKGKTPDGNGDIAYCGNGKTTGHPSAGGGGAAWNLPDIVLAAYVLNPVIVGQCAALSGDVLGRVLPLAALAAAGSRRPGVTAAALAAAACLWRFYAAPLILPAALMLGNDNCSRDVDCILDCGLAGNSGTSSGSSERSAAGSGRAGGNGPERRKTTSEGRRRLSQGPANGVADTQASGGDSGVVTSESVDDDVTAQEPEFDPRYFELDGMMFLRLLAAFAAWCAVILGVCWAATSGSWAFLGAAANGQLLCEDLTPNMGLYWYFFAEVFPRFRGFFRVLFLSHSYVYVLPATLRLGMFPEALVRGQAYPSWERRVELVQVPEVTVVFHWSSFFWPGPMVARSSLRLIQIWHVYVTEPIGVDCNVPIRVFQCCSLRRQHSYYVIIIDPATNF